MQAAPLYETLASSIRHLIDSGTIKPGERMVSLREVSQRRSVSLSTAVQAYRMLEAQGLIEARPQSGYFVRRELWAMRKANGVKSLRPGQKLVQKPAKPVNVDVNSLVMELLTAPSSPDVFALGSASPGPELFPSAAINRILGQIIRRRPHDFERYRSGPGSDDLRRELGRRSLDWGLSLGYEEFVITNGSMEALNLAVRAVAKTGDVVAVETPTYFGFLQILESLGLKALHIPCDPQTGLDVDALEAVLERRQGAPRIAALLCSPNISNPTGATMPDEAKARLARLAAKHQLPVIEDDIYGDLYFGARRPKAVRAWDTEGWVMLCGSFTKILSPGLRVGWIAGRRFNERIRLLKYTSSICTTVLPQLALAEYLQRGPYDKHLRTLRRTLASNAAQAREIIMRNFPEGTQISQPHGGYVLWLELPKPCDALELYKAARAENISIAPGTLFSAAGECRRNLRVAFGIRLTPAYEKALARVGVLAQQQMPRVVAQSPRALAFPR